MLPQKRRRTLNDEQNSDGPQSEKEKGKSDVTHSRMEELEVTSQNCIGLSPERKHPLNGVKVRIEVMSIVPNRVICKAQQHSPTQEKEAQQSQITAYVIQKEQTVKTNSPPALAANTTDLDNSRARYGQQTTMEK